MLHPLPKLMHEGGDRSHHGLEGLVCLGNGMTEHCFHLGRTMVGVEPEGFHRLILYRLGE
ncbi:hypothetical protein SDC9_55094 [bioreactor metagenome]|uniref:Uncharacterized protein n=1 Tax=bioreactor metagenome TaxID=1076179 RepID=A0A644WZ67_9ZZZZ